MAVLALAAGGAALSSAVGLGWSVGWTVGSFLGRMLFSGSDTQNTTVEGPRLGDLSVSPCSTSTRPISGMSTTMGRLSSAATFSTWPSSWLASRGASCCR